MFDNHFQTSSVLLVWLICLSAVTGFARKGPLETEKAVHYSGRILDTVTGEPIARARITLTPPNWDCVWRTDSDGRFSFWVPSQSDREMKIERENYQSISLRVQRGALNDIRLSPSSNAVQLTASRDTAHLMPPSQAVAPAIITAESGPKLSGTGGNWSRWYRLGVGKAPGGYTVERVEFWLSGDRACGTGAECREIIRNDKQVLWEFRLQGHSERGAPPKTCSVAYIRVLYLPRQ
jgi:hypothetical protein